MNDHKNFSLTQTILPTDVASRYSKKVLTTSLSELYMYTTVSVGIVPGQRLVSQLVVQLPLEQWPMPTEENLLRRTEQPVSSTKTSPDRDHRILETRRYIYVLHSAFPDQNKISTSSSFHKFPKIFSSKNVLSRPKKSFSGQLDRNKRIDRLVNVIIT